MTVKMKYNSLLVFRKKDKKYFYTVFGDRVNIIYGKNTSGKSTLIQLIHYAFGINDETDKLYDILEEDIVVRLECTLSKNNKNEEIIFIRDKENLYVKRADLPIEVFNGISGNSAFEHDRLKKYIRDLFDFTLYLEQKGQYKTASIETIFLPYYIAQDVGWISLRKSFKGMDFYKNFREDLLDYYVGITNKDDRIEKIKIEKELKETQSQLEFFNGIESNSPKLTISKLVDDEYTKKTKNYLDEHKDDKEELLKKEREYVLKCNELSYLKERKSILQKVKKNLKKQNPLNDDKCPVCNQKLLLETSNLYEYLQDKNDTDEELASVKSKIKELQRDIDKYSNTISEIRTTLNKEYEILQKYTTEEITYDKWLDHKTNLKLVETIDSNLKALNDKEDTLTKKLEKFKSDDDIKKERSEIETKFWKIFSKYLSNLGVGTSFKDERFKKLYRITVFPFQGVELHKTILSYNFSFNKLIKDTDSIHRLPFLLDAIFKEDIEMDNKKKIIDFISKNKPSDTQIIFSIAESDKETLVKYFNKEYFDNQAKLICIANKKKERAFLDTEFDDFKLIDKTNLIINNN